MRSRRMTPWLAAVGSSALLAIAAGAVVVTPALAGGWATVLIDHETSASEGAAGEPIGITFTVLQHGVTPVNTDEATVVAVEAETGDVVRVAATPTGSGGVYRATLVLPHEGRWRWQVELAGLMAHSQYQDVAVAAPAAPAVARSAAHPGPAVVVALVGGLFTAAVLWFATRFATRRRPTEALSRR